MGEAIGIVAFWIVLFSVGYALQKNFEERRAQIDRREKERFEREHAAWRRTQGER